MKFSVAFVVAGLASFASAELEKRTNTNIDSTILQYALTLEHLEANFYAGALKRFSALDFTAAGYPSYVRERIAETASQEATHVTALSQALGEGATKPCKYSFGYDTVDEFLAISRVLEGVGVSAYLGAAPLITGKNYLAVAGSVLSVEARHEAQVDTFTGNDGAPAAFDTPLGFSQVYSLAAPFIKSCPSSNPKLPVVQFPTLTIKTESPASGKSVQFSFKAKSGKTYYAHFLNGLSAYPVRVNSKQQASVPKNLGGRVYVVISTSQTLTDKNTVAGPALFTLPSTD